MGKATSVRNPVIRTPQTSDLSAPVGMVMRPTLTVEAIDSLARASGLLRENGGTVLPVLNAQGRLQGVLTDAGLARALAETSEATDAVGPYAEPAETIPLYATAAEALRRGVDGRTRVVVDDVDRVAGLVSAMDLWPRLRVPPRPVAVGGMATPFGVYLTTGAVSAGAPWWALMATGATMFTFALAGKLLAGAAVAHGLPFQGEEVLAGVVFFGLMRLAPLSGTHGAEHQVVHAIEREEPLRAEVVRRMPLVHPRCGTNLFVGLTIFMAVFGSRWSADDTLRLLAALILSATLAVPLGSLFQKYVTTRRPNDRQLAGAILAGESLLQRNATTHRIRPNPLRRIWNMGMLQVIVGATLMLTFVAAMKALTGATWLPDVS